MFPRLGLFLLLAATAWAQGGPPMLTDDPGTVPAGHWEINSAFTTEQRPGSRGDERPLLDLNYGLTARLHLKYEAAWVRRDDGAGTHAGMGNSLVGAKWRFYDAGEKDWQVSTYPQVEFNTPGSHADERGLAERGPAFLLPVQVRRDFGAFAFNADLGCVWRRAGGTGWFGGVALGREVAHGVELAAELHGENDGHLRQTRLTVNVGTRFELTEKFTLLASVGREVRNPVEPRASLVAYLGLQTRF